MAGQPEDALPDELQRWVDERVADSDEDPADVLSRAVSLYRLVEERATSTNEEMPSVEDVESSLEQLTSQVSELDDRVGGLEDGLEEKITDVRDRVIQVKREADAKAPAEHDHEEIREQLDTLDGRLDRGFDNYEEILTYLTDETENLDGKIARLAQVVVSLRRRTERIEQHISRTETVNDLKRAANRQGVRKAKCEDCGESVALGLLTEPACPHCESGFVGVEPSGRLFSAGTLLTGGPPALTAGDDPDDAERNGQRSGGGTNGGSSGRRTPQRRWSRSRKVTEEPDETTETGSERERVHRPDDGRDGADDDALGDLTRRIREKREKQGSQNQRDDESADDPADSTEAVGFDFSDTAGDSEDESGDELFEEMDVSDVDTDAIWDSVLTDEADGEEGGSISPNVDIDTAVTVDSTVGQDHIVPKDDYCESCQYFSSPPEVACSYEDAAVVEVLEAGQFRVRNCPVVEGFITTEGSLVEQEDDGGVAEETPSD